MLRYILADRIILLLNGAKEADSGAQEIVQTLLFAPTENSDDIEDGGSGSRTQQ